MNLIDRFLRFVRGNVDAAVDSLQDPLVTLDLILDDLRREVAQARARVAAALAEQKLLEKQIAEQADLVGVWRGRAERAVAAGDDRLAREALTEKKRAELKHEDLGAGLRELMMETVRLRRQLADMEHRVDGIAVKKTQLAAKGRVAEARYAAGLSLDDPLRERPAHTAFTAVEDQIRRIDALADAENALAQARGDLQRERQALEIVVDLELAAMKAKRKG